MFPRSIRRELRRGGLRSGGRRDRPGRDRTAGGGLLQVPGTVIQGQEQQRSENPENEMFLSHVNLRLQSSEIRLRSAKPVSISCQ